MSDQQKDAPSQSVNPFREDPEAGTPGNKQVGHDSAAYQFVRHLGMDLAKGEFDLPPFPDTALKVQESVKDPNSDIQSLAVIVAREPALAARLMRMANSAVMRRGPIEVTDIPTAISRVGLEMVQNVAVSFAAREAFKAPPGSPCINHLNSLRQVSIRVAAFAYAIAGHVIAFKKPEEAMLAGLLNSVGKFYIYTKASGHPDLFADREALNQLLQQWHTGVARAIVESWDFPETIAVAVEEQEIRERDRIGNADLSDVLFVANLLGRAGPQAAGAFGDLDALARMRLSDAKLVELLDEDQAKIESMIEALSG